ncbi:MAG: class I SAM-dependent methyltransferase [Chloroflexi bacterium]|nr:class I SAM-dependent methyltransferase [Chloroflexota bacterium]
MRPEIKQTLDDLERQLEAEPRPGPGMVLEQRMLAVGRDSALFLNSLIRATGAKRVIEVGGSFGYSGIWMGEAVEANSGRLSSLEYVATKATAIRDRIAQAGLQASMEVLEGDALQTLAALDGPFDFVLVDAWKDDYPAYFDLVFPKVRTGGLIVADNITFPPHNPGEGIDLYLQRARNRPDAQSQLVPIGSGLELTLKLG